MANSPQAVSGCRARFPVLQHPSRPAKFIDYPPVSPTRSRQKGFALAERKIAILPRGEFDLTELRVPAIIIRTSLLWRADKPGVRTRATRMAPKYIFVTGGVVSSLGKGVAASSIGCLLESRGFKVTLQKCDPYLNVDPGTMSGSRTPTFPATITGRPGESTKRSLRRSGAEIISGKQCK